MAKIKSAYYCQNCGSQSSKWIGKCPSCNEWNTYVEEIIQKQDKIAKLISGTSKKNARPNLISEVKPIESHRIIFEDKEFNRVLGGGLVLGSVVLIGGEPGIGKSTLLLKTALQSSLKVLYISGEESNQQIKLRADRISTTLNDCFLLQEVALEQIIQQANNLNPEMLIIDSIQTLRSESIESSAGSVSQIRECTSSLIQFAKSTNIPVILIGHITKEGSIAGPKVLEHMVDTVLQFEGDQHHVYRILRSVKNRFGSANELGIYEMTSKGLSEVDNPSKILINNKEELLSGVAIASTVEGLRPMLLEIQALTSTAAYGTPQRSSTGYNIKRLNMILAVLEKRCGFNIGKKDVFLNITGGIKVDDPAIDLAVVCAILSSNYDLHLDSKTCFAAEVGLSGEIRPVSRIDQRINEAEKLGFTRIFISKYCKETHNTRKIKLIKLGEIRDVVNELFK